MLALPPKFNEPAINCTSRGNAKKSHAPPLVINFHYIHGKVHPIWD